ncbi:MAG: hypothetical protein SCK28_12465 [Bacillota bacterium]|nr:hypothetical protein [Bacillota bacterium]
MLKKVPVTIIGLGILIIIILIVAPAEKTLGESVKLVYLHGAVTKASFYLFYLTALAGTIYLFTQRDKVYVFMFICQKITTLYWIIGFIVSTIAMGVIWESFYWQEPRFIMFVGIAILAGANLLLSTAKLNNNIIAGFNIFLAAIVWYLSKIVGRIMHPIDPIGTSTSQSIKMYYLALIVVILLMMVELIRLAVQKYSYK